MMANSALDVDTEILFQILYCLKMCCDITNCYNQQLRCDVTVTGNQPCQRSYAADLR